MKIFSKKSFALGEGVTQNNPDGFSIVTQPGTFQNIPDNLKSDPMLLAAMAEGSILLVDSNEDKKKAENSYTNAEVKDINPKDRQD